MRRWAVIAGCGAALLAIAGCAFVHPARDRGPGSAAQSARSQELGAVAQTALDQQDYARAQGALEQLAAEAPHLAEAHQRLGQVLQAEGRPAEAEAAYRKALGLDPEYLPAKIELCQTLLRLGDEADGWKLAAEIFAKDGYNVVAFNLVTLRDRLNGFRTLKGDGFVVRMETREADLYGPHVLELLRRARTTLGAKRRRGNSLDAKMCPAEPFTNALAWSAKDAATKIPWYRSRRSLLIWT